MFYISSKGILTLPLILLLLQGGHGGSIRKVIYREEINDDALSSSLEEFPPREEWFRVRGDSILRNQAKALGHGPSDVVALTSGRTAGRNMENTSGPPGRNTESSSEGTNDEHSIKVQIRNRGGTGFQNDRRGNRVGTLRDDDSVEQQYSPIRPTNGLMELSKLPPGARQKNWYQHIRHENGHRNTKTIGQRVDMLSPEQPSEADGNSRPVKSSFSRKSYENGDENDHYTEGTNFVQSETEVSPIRTVQSQRRVLAAENSDSVSDETIAVFDIEEENSDDNSPTPPPHEQVAKMARYIVHNSNWSSVATISTMSKLKGYPFVNIVSVSDGPSNNSSGIPYMYVTPLDMSVTDLKSDSRTSLTMSLAQSDYCRVQQLDPEDPRCAHVIVSGKFERVTQSNEIQFARSALFSKHPEMEGWPTDHGWFFAKLNIEHVIVLDYFGGAKTVQLDDYFNVVL